MSKIGQKRQVNAAAFVMLAMATGSTATAEQFTAVEVNVRSFIYLQLPLQEI